MITGDTKNKLDNLWNAMWSNQMTNPWIDIQQVTYLIFIKMLDDNQLKIERKINGLISHGAKIDLTDYDLVFKEGNYIDQENNINVPYSDLRWNIFSQWSDNEKVFKNLKNNVFPFIKQLHGDKVTSFAKYMEKAEFEISNPYILGKMITSLSDETLGFNDKDLMGDCYEYLLSKMATSGDNGQFRTPRHIIDFMVEIAKPTLNDNIIDPAMGTAGFLTESAKYIQNHYFNELTKKENNKHFHNTMFTGFDTDTDMLRIGCMNMTLHGVENPSIKYNNSLSEEYAEADKYSLILANPPFKGSLDPSTVSKSLNIISGGTKKTELLFLSLFLRLLKVGGRCISVVPGGILNNTNEAAYTKLRKELVENQKLEGIIFIPGGVFQPYSGVQTGVIIFQKTNAPATDKVWMYNMESDGYSLNKTRDQVDTNDIPDILNRWENLKNEESRTKYDKSFFVTKEEIANNNYVLSFNNYHQFKMEQRNFRDEEDILKSLKQLESEFKSIIDSLDK